MAWACPSCGRSFKNKNQWHACGEYNVAAHFEGMPPEIRAAYDALETFALGLKGTVVDPVKTRIQFKRSSTWASIAVKKRALQVSLALPSDVRHARLNFVEMHGGRRVCWFALHAAGDFDDDVRAWLWAAWDAA